jgi:superfamily II DNA or RNA helicase
MRLDTGGGKTVTLADIVREHAGASCVIAHRQELVGQLSITLARYGIRHNIIAAETTRRAIAKAHVEELGYCLYDPGALCVVASVDTLVRAELPPAWVASVTLWVVDEGHHLVIDNKWHNAIGKFTNDAVRGLLPTATPKRADGKGLGRGQGGVADVMVSGPPMRWLIDEGYLSDYRIICPPSDLQIMAEAGASGDWSSKQGREASARSHIVGDVVVQYLKWAKGKLGITFATDVVTATEMTAAYRTAGVKAETLTGKTDDYVRRQILRRFAAREVEQIVAVDIISEGFDLPAIEVASMARPTQSLALYMQQFGRTLRVMPGKDKALIIDHAGNVVRHEGPPDLPRAWSLARRDGGRSGASGGIPIAVCTECFYPYRAILRACPNCGHTPLPAGRARPDQVAGDLEELHPDVLAAMRAKVEDVDKDEATRRSEMALAGWSQIVAAPQLRHHAARQDAQGPLRTAMVGFCARGAAIGWGSSEIHRAFWFRFGVDVMTARTLGAKDAAELTLKINMTPPAFFA